MTHDKHSLCVHTRNLETFYLEGLKKINKLIQFKFIVFTIVLILVTKHTQKSTDHTGNTLLGLNGHILQVYTI